MPKDDPKSCEDLDESCFFCLIARNLDQETKIVKQDEELVCFPDICPAAPLHYLVIPKKHIHSCRSLDSGHISLVEKMAEFGKTVLREQGISNTADVRLGFHQPPFISVGHLHLHVLAPASKIFLSMEYKFTPGTDRFIAEDSLKRQILKKQRPLCHHS